MAYIYWGSVEDNYFVLLPREFTVEGAICFIEEFPNRFYLPEQIVLAAVLVMLEPPETLPSCTAVNRAVAVMRVAL